MHVQRRFHQAFLESSPVLIQTPVGKEKPCENEVSYKTEHHNDPVYLTRHV